MIFPKIVFLVLFVTLLIFPAYTSVSTSATEICDNSFDDDGDGLTDSEDTEDCRITQEPEEEGAPDIEEPAEGEVPEEEPALDDCDIDPNALDCTLVGEVPEEEGAPDIEEPAEGEVPEEEGAPDIEEPAEGEVPEEEPALDDCDIDPNALDCTLVGEGPEIDVESEPEDGEPELDDCDIDPNALDCTLVGEVPEEEGAPDIEEPAEGEVPEEEGAPDIEEPAEGEVPEEEGAPDIEEPAEGEVPEEEPALDDCDIDPNALDCTLVGEGPEIDVESEPEDGEPELDDCDIDPNALDCTLVGEGPEIDVESEPEDGEPELDDCDIDPNASGCPSVDTPGNTMVQIKKGTINSLDYAGLSTNSRSLRGISVYVVDGDWGLNRVDGKGYNFAAYFVMGPISATQLQSYSISAISSTNIDSSSNGNGILFSGSADIYTEDRLRWRQIPLEVKSYFNDRVITIMVDPSMTNNHFQGLAILGLTQ